MFLDAAFYLVPLGFKIFPLLAGAKIPAISKAKGGRGCLDATDDDDIIEDWAWHLPKANIGIATGLPSKCIVIDLDPRNGSDKSVADLKKAGFEFPPTVTARTANGGTHFYYAYEPSLKNSKSVLAPGIDIKTTGGYVVAPPSVLDGGKRYRWENSPLGGDFPKLPAWAIKKLKPAPPPVFKRSDQKPSADIAPLVNFVARSGEGVRNNSLFWAACRAAETGLLDAGGAATLAEAAQATGLDKMEAEKTIASARKKVRLT
jgi:hypothetical protein